MRRWRWRGGDRVFRRAWLSLAGAPAASARGGVVVDPAVAWHPDHDARWDWPGRRTPWRWPDNRRRTAGSNRNARERGLAGVWRVVDGRRRHATRRWVVDRGCRDARSRPDNGGRAARSNRNARERRLTGIRRVVDGWGRNAPRWRIIDRRSRHATTTAGWLRRPDSRRVIDRWCWYATTSTLEREQDGKCNLHATQCRSARGASPATAGTTRAGSTNGVNRRKK